MRINQHVGLQRHPRSDWGLQQQRLLQPFKSNAA
jgi:hypothetical protein